MAGIAAHILEAHPDIVLDVFDQVAEVDAAVGIGPGGGTGILRDILQGSFKVPRRGSVNPSPLGEWVK